MIVMKFGGTSVEDAAAIRRLIEIVRLEIARRPLVVVSACSGVTNELLRMARAVQSGNRNEGLATIAGIKERHQKIASELLSGTELHTTNKILDEMIIELCKYVDGVHLLGELTDRSLDAITSFGERLSSRVIHSAFVCAGVPAALIDARAVMTTDNAFVSAAPLMEETKNRAQTILLPLLKQGQVVITQGFIGASKEGITTTIGRGGSDYSASIFGAACRAEEIQIWTDVDGMMSADPRIVPDARLISAMSFDEASELAYFGAKVLHPKTILPAVQKKIPVRILNSRRPSVKGTRIVASLDEISERQGDVVKSIACKKGISVINISSSRMLMAHGFLARLFSIFAEHRKSVDVVATSEVSVSLTIDSDEDLSEILQQLNGIGETQVRHQKAIICVVGEGMRNTPGIAARIFQALAHARVNIEMVSEGASEINLTIVVDENAVTAAVKALHQEFFK